MKMKDMPWSTDSKDTEAFCKRFGYLFECGFVQTARVTVNGKEYLFVSGTLGKREEFSRLRSRCEAVAEEGYVYVRPGDPKETVGTALYHHRAILENAARIREIEGDDSWKAAEVLACEAAEAQNWQQ
jgi:hypothetical protein